MSSWKPTAQAGRDEQLVGHNHMHSNLNSTPQLADCCYYPGDRKWLGCLCHWGESPGTHFFQLVPSVSESQVEAASEGTRKTGSRALSFPLGWWALPSTKSHRVDSSPAPGRGVDAEHEKGEMCIKGGISEQEEGSVNKRHVAVSRCVWTVSSDSVWSSWQWWAPWLAGSADRHAQC